MSKPKLGKQLLNFVEKATSEGHFYFTEQFHTEYHINTNMIFQYPRFVDECAKELYKLFEDIKVDIIVTPDYRAGFILAHNVAERFNIPVKLFRRGKRGLVYPFDFKLNKKNVLIIDDGINTGYSLNEMFKTIRHDLKGKIVGVGVFLNRYHQNLKKDFEGKVSTLLDLQKKYVIIDRLNRKCKLCKEKEKIIMELKKEKNKARNSILLRQFESIKERCVYGYLD